MGRGFSNTRVSSDDFDPSGRRTTERIGPRAVPMPNAVAPPPPSLAARLRAQERKILHIACELRALHQGATLQSVADERLHTPAPLLMAVSLPGEGDWRVYELTRDGSTFDALAAPDLLTTPAATPHRKALAAVLSGTTRESRTQQAREAITRIEDFRERVSSYHFEVVCQEILGTHVRQESPE
jgi:hypothetical protein